MLKLFAFESHPIAEMLGLSGEAQVGDGNESWLEVRPLLAFTAMFDFVLQTGRVVFDFASHQPPPTEQVAGG